MIQGIRDARHVPVSPATQKVKKLKPLFMVVREFQGVDENIYWAILAILMTASMATLIMAKFYNSSPKKSIIDCFFKIWRIFCQRTLTG